MIRTLFNIVVSLFFLVTKAQENSLPVSAVELSRAPNLHSAIKGLKVGDKIPNVNMGKLVNSKLVKPRTGDFNDQLLLLDFMDTYCVNCITVLPKLDTLQQKFGSRIRIFPVTWEKQEYIRKWLAGGNAWVKKKNIQLPWIVEDTLLAAYFKHKIVSHIVWIYKGVVKAITGTDYVTTHNINAVLNGDDINWQVKNDELYFDPKQPIFTNKGELHNPESRFTAYSGIAGFRDGIDYKGGIAFDSVQNRTYFYNFSVVEAYTALMTTITPKKYLIRYPNRVMLEVKDPGGYIYDPSKGYADAWNKENKFCFEMVTGERFVKKERLELAVNELNNLLGLDVRFEKRKMPCLVLVQGPGGAKPDSSQRPANAQKISVSVITFFYIDLAMKFPPAIDETNYKGDIFLKKSYMSLDDLKQDLQVNGFDLIEAEREIEVLVFTERGYKRV